MFIHVYVYLYICCIAYVYISWFCSYKIDRLMGGGASGAPRLLNYQFHMKKIQKYIYIQKQTKNMQIHINICKNVEKCMKKYKHLREFWYPHPLVYQFYMKKIQKYIQKHTKNIQIHINICKNVEKYIKKYKHLHEENIFTVSRGRHVTSWCWKFGKPFWCLFWFL